MLEVIEPATETVLAVIDEATEVDVDLAVERAQQAQRFWSATPPERKARTLSAIAAAIESEAENLAAIESRNVGMPITDARIEVHGAAETFRYFAAIPERLCGQTIPVAGGIDMTFREPIGVAGLITPWNFPLAIACWKIAPALAGGNAVVIKPSALTPLTTVELERIAINAGLPEGLINVVIGAGRTVGEHLVGHPAVSKIAFTGSTVVGRDIARRAAQAVKRVTLELGGKSASIVFEDADLEAAARGLAGGVFGNAGQDCCARSRVFVQSSVIERFLDALKRLVEDLKVGDPGDESTQMGPLISAAHRDRVASYVSDAPVACRGSVPDGPGYWFAPTVLHPIEDGHRATREEIFGPVVAVLPFETELEVVERANDTIYGLSGSIWTSDGARALRTARALDTGTVAINSYTSVRVSTPFGGFKQSGLGRELGSDAVHSYTELKNVFYATGS